MSNKTRSDRPSIRLTVEESWRVIADSHTGIFTSLRRDGAPVALPVWFVVHDGIIWLSTPARSKKVTRVRNDSRTSFLVESGERWADLRAVHAVCRATLIDDTEIARWVDDLKAEKYAAYRTPRSEMADATRSHYEAQRVAIRLEPEERLVSWDNRRLGLSGG